MSKRDAEPPTGAHSAGPPVHVSPEGVSYVRPSELVRSPAFRAALEGPSPVREAPSEEPSVASRLVRLLAPEMGAAAPAAGERERPRLILTEDQLWQLEQMHNLSMSPEQYDVWELIWRHYTARLPAPVESPPRELLCQLCSRECPVWYAPNEMWNAVVRDEHHFLCPTCFTRLAAQRGVQDGFRLTAYDAPAESQALREALRALYVEGVQSGVEDALDAAHDCRATLNAILAAKGGARREAARFFDEEWPDDLREGSEWTALDDVLRLFSPTVEREEER